MNEANPRIFHHFAGFSFTDAHDLLPPEERLGCHREWLDGLRRAAETVEVYQVYPARTDVDLLVWSAITVQPDVDAVEDLAAAGCFFERFARATNLYRGHIRPVSTLWGFTKPSQYSRAARSAQEIDPFSGERLPYLVLYPFSKTADWYLMSREARGGMMNEHIRIGKQYGDIKQLLLYSTGLQDQEFVVAYETDNLGRFSDLVTELRDTEARRYTLRDTPITTAVHHRPEDTLALWE